MAFLGTPTTPADEKPWVVLESHPFPFLMSSAIGAGSGCWRGKQRGQAALLGTEILIKVHLKAAPSVHIARARWTAAQHIAGAVTRPPEHQLFWGQGKPQGDVNLTSVLQPRDGRGHGQHTAGEGPRKAIAQGRCPKEQLSQHIHWDMEPSTVTDGFCWPRLTKGQLPLGNKELF